MHPDIPLDPPLLHVNRGVKEYGYLIFSLVSPSLRRTHTARALCELTAAVIRRNARALCLLLPEHHHQQHQDNSIFDYSTLRMRIRDLPTPMPAPISSPPACAPGHKVTRTGRVIQAPQRLDL